MNRLKLWFGFSDSISRRTYLVNGLGLMCLKYGVDSLIFWLGTQRVIAPLDYLHPSIAHRLHALDLDHLSDQSFTWWLVASLLWSLPFIWIGVSMSARRAINAGLSKWIGLLFFLPVVNYLVILTLSLLPTREHVSMRPVAPSTAGGSVLKSALSAIGLTVLVGIAVIAFSVLGFHDYGANVFVGTPFVMGALGAHLVHKDGYRGWRVSIGVALASTVICGGALIILALEGALCLLMAAPIALALTALGALVGGAMVQLYSVARTSLSAMVIALPIFSIMGLGTSSTLAEHSVVTTVEINVPPEQVWPNVVGFSELPPPSDWLLKTGIAIPIRARIKGSGVGAIRYCEFTTGPFVEPITVWDYPRRLAFDVTAQPPSMQEWSPYELVHAPHLVGTMVSRRGQFKLVPLSGGKTRLEGTTWYTLDMAPAFYWTVWSDVLVHRIHQRVLRHIKQLSESGTVTASRGSHPHK